MRLGEFHNQVAVVRRGVGGLCFFVAAQRADMLGKEGIFLRLQFFSRSLVGRKPYSLSLSVPRCQDGCRGTRQCIYSTPRAFASFYVCPVVISVMKNARFQKSVNDLLSLRRFTAGSAVICRIIHLFTNGGFAQKFNTMFIGSSCTITIRATMSSNVLMMQVELGPTMLRVHRRRDGQRHGIRDCCSV